MANLSILSLTLLFSMLFFLANGTTIELENSEQLDALLREETPEQVKNWYAQLHKKKQVLSTFKVYLHANNRINQIQVAHSLVNGSTPPFFGDIYAFDYTATAEQDVNSEYLGAGQGFFVENSQEQFAALLGINLSLTKFANSTIILLGQDRFNDKYRELPVVGGTGNFRLATGSAVMFNVFRVTDVAIIELTAFVRHYVQVPRAKATA